MRINTSTIFISFLFLIGAITFQSCKKLIAIPDPINTVNTSQIFATETQANGALAGGYSRRIHGDDPISVSFAGSGSCSAGLSTMLGGLSSDEFFLFPGPANASEYAFSTNQLTAINNGESVTLWNSAYTTIYAEIGRAHV